MIAGGAITFTETMHGPFALGSDDPAAGAAEGERAGTILVFHANIRIDDIDAFVADPEHQARLSGDVSFPPIGGKLRSIDGVFQLFSPGDRPGLKLMVYEQGLEHRGKAYYVAGHKNVENDPGFDMWPDTTTLYTRLHEGPDKGAPVIGAGILRLDLKEFLRILSTIRVRGCGSLPKRLSTKAKLGRFFAGELWDMYGSTSPGP